MTKQTGKKAAAFPAFPEKGVDECLWEDCEGKVHARGICQPHYLGCIGAMKRDPKITWEGIEEEGLSLPPKSMRRSDTIPNARHRILEMFKGRRASSSIRKAEKAEKPGNSRE